MSAINLANFLMFTVSGENTVKCLEGFSWKKSYLYTIKNKCFTCEICEKNKVKNFKHLLENLRQFFGIFGSLRTSSEIFGNFRRMAGNRSPSKEIPWYIKPNNIRHFGAVLVSFWKKLLLYWWIFYCYC